MEVRGENFAVVETESEDLTGECYMFELLRSRHLVHW